MRVSTSPIHHSACTDIKESAVGVCAEIAKLQRVLGKTTLENEIPKEAGEYAAEKVDCAPACARPAWAR